MSGPFIFILVFALSFLFAYLVGKFSPNLWVVALAVGLVQAAGYGWTVMYGFFSGQSILELLAVLLVTFVWYMIAAQFHLWEKERRSLASGDN